MSVPSHFFQCPRLFAAILVVAGLQVFCSPSPAPQTATTTIIVFEDRNGNGQQDPEEPPIPDTLVAERHNQHGLLTHTLRLTDGQGQARIEAEYTHFFDIKVQPPCGYRATKDAFQSAVDQPQLSFGFAPEHPNPGAATIRFRFWIDRNGNGLQESDELPLQQALLYVQVWEPHGVYQAGNAALVTDAEGWATLELGNSCDWVWVCTPEGWQTTFTNPAPIERATVYEADWQAFPYDVGTMEVEWGVQASAPGGELTPIISP